MAECTFPGMRVVVPDRGWNAARGLIAACVLMTGPVEVSAQVTAGVTPSIAQPLSSSITERAIASANFHWRKAETAHAALYFGSASYTPSAVARI
ncbi:MAG TPA: hypothetical protein VGO75_01695, partial [Gemmatimonadaceae bacterium]|nr:hypothetical protein [Gemmatimonadaceae bacterium]